MLVVITKLPKAEVEIVGELSVPEFTAYRERALKTLNQSVKIDGFRPGQVPEQVLISKIGEEKILLEMAEMALQENYPKIVAENKIDALGQPEITLTKLAKDNPLGFKIKTAVNPEVTLPDFKKIAKEANSKPLTEIKVEDKEVDKVLAELEKNKTDLSKIENPKEKIRENLKLEKTAKQKDKRRLEIAEAVVKETKLEVPNLLIETEADKMLHEMRGQIERMGLKFEEYLKHLKKEERDLRAEWRGDAERRVRTALVLAKIAEVEKIGAPEAEVEKEVKHLKKHYEDAPEERLRTYIGNLLINEYVFRFLEEQK